MSRLFTLEGAEGRQIIVVALLMSLLGPRFTAAQTIDPRVVAGFGPVCEPVRETAIAAGEHKVIALFMAGPSGNTQVHYGIYDIQSGTWSEGIVPMGDFLDIADPSIA